MEMFFGDVDEDSKGGKVKFFNPKTKSENKKRLEKYFLGVICFIKMSILKKRYKRQFMNAKKKLETEFNDCLLLEEEFKDCKDS